MFDTQENPIPELASTSSLQQRHATAESSTKRANPLPGRRKTKQTAQATARGQLGEPSSSSIASLHSSRQGKHEREKGPVSSPKRQCTSAMDDGDLPYIGIDLTEGGGREGGRDERRGRLSTLKITSSVVDKWQPLSAGATKLLCDAMEAAIV